MGCLKWKANKPSFSRLKHLYKELGDVFVETKLYKSRPTLTVVLIYKRMATMQIKAIVLLSIFYSTLSRVYI